MPRPRRDKDDARTRPPWGGQTAPPAAQPRIIGGRFRGRKLVYSGDPRTRPMKDRVREAVFNLLGTWVEGKHAIDLFAGTGALGLEALSRGAAHATFLERHFPTADLIHENIAALDVKALCHVIPGDTFLWARRLPIAGSEPWVVFCSPPYDFYVERVEEMLRLIEDLVAASPLQSLFVVEADARFDFSRLPSCSEWDVRSYPPAVVGIYEKKTAP
jgi:16S rRNA (guanine966-N2)-methyltransferase